MKIQTALPLLVRRDVANQTLDFFSPIPEIPASCWDFFIVGNPLAMLQFYDVDCPTLSWQTSEDNVTTFCTTVLEPGLPDYRRILVEWTARSAHGATYAIVLANCKSLYENK